MYYVCFLDQYYCGYAYLCRVTPLVRDGQVEPSVAKYLNRLSDFLFVAARHVSHQQGYPEDIYFRNN